MTEPVPVTLPVRVIDGLEVIEEDGGGRETEEGIEVGIIGSSASGLISTICGILVVVGIVCGGGGRS